MRPIELKIQAFGSYAEETINFTKPNQNIFLVTGDTGAGKTTIFDAMVFALYGEASSGIENRKKDGKELQSQFASANTTPFVELTFSENDKIYRVIRSPQHELQKKGGKGTTDKSERVELFLPGEDRQYSGSNKEIDNKIVEIVGVNKAQFMQIGMIAQGEFMQLLLAKTKDKKEIFRKLFNTELFDRVVNEFDRRRKEQFISLNNVKTELKTLAGQANIPAWYDDAQDFTELKNKITKDSSANIADVDAFYGKLTALCDSLEKRLREYNEEYTKAEKEHLSLVKQETEAKELSGAFYSYRKADADLQDLSSQKAEIEEKEALLKKLDAAFEAESAKKSFDESSLRVSDTLGKLSDEKNRLPQLEQVLANCSTAEENSSALLNAANEEFIKTDSSVREAKELFEKIRVANNKLKVSVRDLAAARTECERLRKEKDKLETEEKSLKLRKEALSDAPIQLEKWNQRKEETDAIKSELKELENTADSYKILKSAQKTAEEEHRKADEECKNKIFERNDIEHKFLLAQAGLLAKGLKEGMECPVCGSIHHRNLAVLSAELEDITKEKVDAARKKADAAYNIASEKAMTLQRAKTSFEHIEADYNDRSQKLKAHLVKVGMDEIPNEFKSVKLYIKAYCDKLDEEGKELQKNVDELVKGDERLNKIDLLKKELSTDIDNAGKNETEKQSVCDSVNAELQVYLSKKSYESAEQADLLLAKAQDNKNSAEKQYNRLKAEKDAAVSKLTESKTRINSWDKELPLLKADADKKLSEYRQVLAEKKLDEAELKFLLSRYVRADKDRIAAELQDYKEKLTSAKTRKAEYEKKIVGKEEPNLSELSERLIAAEERRNKLKEHQEAVKTVNSADRSIKEQLEQKLKSHRKADEEYSRIKGLHDRLSGKVSHAKMDIETFAQRVYLKKILNAANKRFSAMTSGQYELRIIPEEQAGEGRSNQGLDLMVYSFVTDKEREIRTLSGGESFMAALSLALGMSDQIQAMKGGINLDVIFIDEGFGSLDDASRAEAIRVLKQMAGSSKMIGIISHVTELKQELDNQLIVTKDREKGSHAQWKIS